jgi:hypothetical protein
MKNHATPRINHGTAAIVLAILNLITMIFPRFVAADPDIDSSRIDAYITPYYDSKGPAINVGPFSSGLASGDEKVFLDTIAKMKKQWPQLGFPELYVGAIRLYDLGYRKESIYWFYTAQYRGRQFTMFLDPAKTGSMGDPAFELLQANAAFFQTAGVWINGYAFGDTDGLIKIIRRVQQEGKQIPDLKAVYPNIAFIDNSQWPDANTKLANGMDALVTNLEQNKAQIKQQRVVQGMEAKFSSLTNKDLPTP